MPIHENTMKMSSSILIQNKAVLARRHDHFDRWVVQLNYPLQTSLVFNFVLKTSPDINEVAPIQEGSCCFISFTSQ